MQRSVSGSWHACAPAPNSAGPEVALNAVCGLHDPTDDNGKDVGRGSSSGMLRISMLLALMHVHILDPPVHRPALERDLPLVAKRAAQYFQVLYPLGACSGLDIERAYLFVYATLAVVEACLAVSHVIRRMLYTGSGAALAAQLRVYLGRPVRAAIASHEPGPADVRDRATAGLQRRVAYDLLRCWCLLAVAARSGLLVLPVAVAVAVKLSAALLASVLAADLAA